MLSYSGQLSDAGYSVMPELIGHDDICDLIHNLPVSGAGMRRILDTPWCATLAGRIARDQRISGVLPESPVAVQCTLFSKSTEANWLVPLHQDLSIPVAERVNSEQCSGWSEKEGELFMQPPVCVLEQLLTIRLHLEDCDEQNGALRVVPGSHRLGRLNSSESHQERAQQGTVVVSVPSGGAMLMRPLLLHASSKANVDRPRRVLHFVFGPQHLPAGLRWPPSR
jgi:ectoine hydroxylase-related dioxygenase (phytanoyl-CoA dioxygenase family)